MADNEFSRGAVLDLLAQKYGGSFREANATPTVGVTPLLVAARDHERVELTFVNLGGTNIFLAPTPLVSTTLGLKATPGGGGFSFNADQDGLMTALEWYAVSDAAGGTLYVLSARRETKYL